MSGLGGMLWFALALGASPDVDAWELDESDLAEIDVESDGVESDGVESDGVEQVEVGEDSANEGDVVAGAAEEDGVAQGEAERPVEEPTDQMAQWLAEVDDEPDPFAHLDDERVASWELLAEETDAADATVEASLPEPTLLERGGLRGWGLVLGMKAGAGRAQAAADGLGWTLLGELEVGYTPPLPAPFGRDLELFAAATYAAPSLESAALTDGRVAGDGSWSYRLTLHQAITTLGALYRLPTPVPWLRPYGALGVRGYGSWAVVDGTAGSSALPGASELRFDLGGYGGAGADFLVGPGAVVTELQAGLAFVDGRLLRSSQGTLNVVVGYRFLL